jgi:hypothetical protein
MRGKFLLKMLHFDHGYVTCLYVPSYLAGDACTEYVAILLVYLSILACCSALCLFVKHIRAFTALVYQQGGEICIQSITRGRDAFCKEESLHQRGEKEGYSVQGENLSLHAFVQGPACIHALGALCVA